MFGRARQREQDEANAEAAAEVAALAEAKEARGAFNRLICGDVDPPPAVERLDPPAPTQLTGSADGGEGAAGTEDHVYEWVQTDSGVQRMRVFDLDGPWNDN